METQTFLETGQNIPRVVAQARRLFKDVTVGHLDFFSLDIKE